MSTAIVPKTAAETFNFTVRAGSPVTIHCTGLAGVETIPLTIRSGSVNEPVLNSYDVAVALSATKKQLLVHGAGNYTLTKGVTAGLAGLYIEE